MRVTKSKIFLSVLFGAMLIGLFSVNPTIAQNVSPNNPGPNILLNPGFEEGYYIQDGVAELAVPNHWKMYWIDGQEINGSEGLAYRPETVVWNRNQAPPDEANVFWRDGIYNIKIFKGGHALYSALTTTIAVEKGARYRFIAPVFPDIVERYEGGSKVSPGTAESAGVRLGVSFAGAGWLSNDIAYTGWFNAGNTPGFFFNMKDYVYEFTAPASEVTLWVELFGQKQIPNNGYFIDGLSLRKIGEAIPPTPIPTNTPVPTNTPLPTNTPTPRPTNTPTITPTPLPTGPWFTPVPTLRPTNTPTPLPTGPWFTPTPIPPTSTPVPVVDTSTDAAGDTVETAGGAGQPVAAAPVSAAPAGSAGVVGVQATPDANGVIYAQVGPGDSVWSVAAKNGLTLDEILELNGFEKNEVIFVAEGDFLVVGLAEPSVEEPPAEEAAEEAPEESATEEGSEDSAESTAETQGGGDVAADDAESADAGPVEVTAEPTPEPVSGQICLKAYDDANENAAYDLGEPLRADVAFTVLKDDQVTSSYISRPDTEFFCIEGLDAGAYRITRSQMPNEVLTTAGDVSVALAEGGSVTAEFGSYTQAEEAVAAVSAETEQPAEAEESASEAAPVENNVAAEAADSAPNPTTGILIAVAVAAVLLLLAILVIILSRRGSQ